jgi:hypothetical protein
MIPFYVLVGFVVAVVVASVVFRVRDRRKTGPAAAASTGERKSSVYWED